MSPHLASQHLADRILVENKGVDSITFFCEQNGDEEVKATWVVLISTWRSRSSQALAAALKENRQVTSVYLNQGGFGDAGAEALAEMLHQNRTIKKIVLSSNRITTVGAKAPFEPQSFAAFGFGFFEVAGVAGGTPSQQGCHVHLSQ
eukprot:g24994.t1